VPHVPVLPAGVKGGGWDLTQDDFEDYCHGMPFMASSVLKTLPWIFQNFQSWYFEACSKGIQSIQGKLPGELFGQPSCDINVSLRTYMPYIILTEWMPLSLRSDACKCFEPSSSICK